MKGPASPAMKSPAPRFCADALASLKEPELLFAGVEPERSIEFDVKTSNAIDSDYWVTPWLRGIGVPT